MYEFFLKTVNNHQKIFVFALDFATKYMLKPTNKRTCHRTSTMLKAEFMLIMILFHDSGYRCLKHFHQEKVCKHLRHQCFKTVSYNRFMELGKEVARTIDTEPALF